MSSSARSKLGNSWVDGNMEDDRISWAECSDEEEVEEVSPKPQASHFRNNNSNRSNQQQAYSQSTSSEFMMPSVNGSFYPRKQPRRQSQQQSPRASSQTSAFKKPQAFWTADTTAKGPPRTKKRQDLTNSPTYLWDVLLYIGDVLGASMINLKKPLSWILSIYIGFIGVMFLRNLLMTSIGNAFSPICRLPGVSYLDLPICSYTSRIPNSPTIQPSVASNVNPEFGALMDIHSKFDTLLADSASPSALSLPYEMKFFQGAVRDLRGVIRNSKLPLKGELVSEFEELIKMVGEASWDLGRFNIHVVGATDLVVVTARFAEDALANIATKKNDRGLISAFIQDKLLSPFQPVQFTEAKVLDQYIRHARGISDQIERLLEEARSILLKIQRIEEILEEIHETSQRANVVVESDLDTLLSDLWTKLGGNKDKQSKVAQKLALLKSMSDYRKIAFSHVANAIVKLQGMSAELEELNARMNEPETEKMKGREGVPLTVHIETIRLGIERLRAQSRETSRIQDEYVQGRLDRVRGEREDKGWLVADGNYLGQ